MGKGRNMVKDVVDEVNSDAKKRKEFTGWTFSIQFNLKGEKTPFHVLVKSEKLKLVDGEHPNPNVTVDSTTDVLSQIQSGKLDPVSAYFNRQITVSGNLSEAQKFLSSLGLRSKNK